MIPAACFLEVRTLGTWKYPQLPEPLPPLLLLSFPLWIDVVLAQESQGYWGLRSISYPVLRMSHELGTTRVLIRCAPIKVPRNPVRPLL